MAGSITRDGRLRCSTDRDSHAHWPRFRPCDKLAVVKHQPKGSIVYAYYCDKCAELISHQNDIVQRSPQGFWVKKEGRYLPQIIPVCEDNRPQIIKDMGQVIQRVEWDDERYPERMKSSTNAPDLLSCLGDIALLKTPSIAIVGMQQPTKLGQSIAYRLAAFFARAGYTIVSGLADGIDVAAHQGALSVGGRTVAVLENPLGNTYPTHNRDVARAIVQGKGLLFTNYYTNESVSSYIRKRAYLQAALPLVVIPIQTGVKGRTLHICRNAQIQGCELWVPFPVEWDEQESPECYVGIRRLLRWQNVVPFVGKEDYPMLLERLQRMQ